MTSNNSKGNVNLKALEDRPTRTLNAMDAILPTPTVPNNSST